MSHPDRWTVIEARRTARLVASREQVIAAELDVASMAEVAGNQVRDLVESAPGVPHTWTEVARSGLLRQRFVRTVESHDPLVIRSTAGEMHVQVGTTTVEAAPGADGRIGVTWVQRAEMTAPDGLGRWIQRKARARTQRTFERRYSQVMDRWAAAIEERAAREHA